MYIYYGQINILSLSLSMSFLFYLNKISSVLTNAGLYLIEARTITGDVLLKRISQYALKATQWLSTFFDMDKLTN